MSNLIVEGFSFLKTNKIPDYAKDFKNEYLIIIIINKECGKFLERLDREGNEFNTPQAEKLIVCFEIFLEAQELGYLKDTSEFYFKESDVEFIESLRINLNDYIEIFYNPDSFKLDQEKYENDNTGLREFYESFSKFNDKIKIEEKNSSDYKCFFYFLDSDSD